MAIADFNGLAQLKVKAKANEKAAMQETARQFEALFVQTMLKTMRSSQHFIDEDSPFRSQAEDTFQEMLDAQYAQHISQGDGIGLAKVLVAQMSAQQDKTNPSSAIRIAEDVKPMSQKEGHVGINTQTHSSLSINPAERQQEADTKQDKFSLAEFIKPLLPYAQKAAAILGVDPKILLAQVALETGWGKFIARDENGTSTHNLFNIKAIAGQEKNAVNIKTTEFIADNPVKLSQWFKRYPEPAESFRDYVNLVSSTERYAGALRHGGDSRAYIKALQDAGYATDPKYAEKVLQIYDSEALQKL